MTTDHTLQHQEPESNKVTVKMGKLLQRFPLPHKANYLLKFSIYNIPNTLPPLASSATRALRTFLQYGELFLLATDTKNLNSNSLIIRYQKQGKTQKILTQILLLTNCYYDTL